MISHMAPLPHSWLGSELESGREPIRIMRLLLLGGLDNRSRGEKEDVCQVPRLSSGLTLSTTGSGLLQPQGSHLVWLALALTCGCLLTFIKYSVHCP
jgi:hypothetical protein